MSSSPRWGASRILLYVVVWAIAAFLAPVLAGPDWSSQEVGLTGVPGSFSAKDQTLTLRGSGADIWWAADSFYYLYVPWQGDGQMVARALEVEHTDPWAKAGIMFREDLTGISKQAMIAMTPQQGTAFLRRSQLGGMTSDDSHQAMRMVPGVRGTGFQQRGSGGAEKAVGSIVSSKPPRWIKLVRRADVFIAFDSADGQNWEWVGTDRVAMNQSIYVGLAVSSHNNLKLCAASFDQIQLGPPDAAHSPASDSKSPGSGQGLKGAYFNSRNHSGSSIGRTDPTIDFDWGLGAPLPGIGEDEFTVRWEGELEAQFAEPYAFQVVSDDRIRLWLNAELIIDEWYEHAEAKSTAVVNLEAGRRYVVRLDFFENRGRAMVRFLWSSPSTPLQPVPQSQLYPVITDLDGDGIPDLWEAVEGLDTADPKHADMVDVKDKLTARQRYRGRFDTTLPTLKPQTDLPQPWLHQDIGRVGLQGEAALTNNQWTVRGSGVDIWANSDGFHFLYQPWRGDGQIVARVFRQEATDPWARAGVMIRENLEAESRHLMAAVTPTNGVLFLYRDQLGGNTALESGGAIDGGPVWLKLTRRGSVLTSYRSVDGQTWEWLGTEAMNLPDEIYFGIAVSSHDNSVLGTAVFDSVALGAPSGPPGSPVAKKGKGTGLQATYFDVNSGVVVARIDPTIDFDWGEGSPAKDIAVDFFGARWEGWLEAPASDLYGIHVLSDDGVRLWLDGKLFIDAWTDRSANQTTAKIQLKAQQRYPLKMEFYERDRQAVARLLWSSASMGRQPIPQSQLYPLGPSLLATTNASGADRANGGAPTADGEHGTGRGNTQSTNSVAEAAASAGLPDGVTNVTTVLEMSPSSFVERLGKWQVDGAEIYAVDRRGALEYDLSVPSPDIYQIEIEGISQNAFDLDMGFYLVVSVDGEHMERILLDAGPRLIGRAHILTPYLQMGKHRLRVFWDNARKYRSLRLKAIRLQALDGPDADGNGRQDWVEKKLAKENGLDPASAGELEVTESLLSPACVEGAGRCLSMLKLSSDAQSIAPQAGAGVRWYANVPLSAEKPVALEASFQNGGLVQFRKLVWKHLNLLTATNLVIRQGDSLLFAVIPAGFSASSVSSLACDVEIQNLAHYSGSVTQNFPHRFDQSGQYTLTGSASGPGLSQSNTILVTVLAGSWPDQPAAWVNKPRQLDCPGIPQTAVIEADPRLQLQEIRPLAATGRSLRITIDAAEPRTILARAGEGGPILCQVPVEGFELYAGSATDLAVVKDLNGEGQLIETTIVAMPVLAQVRLEVTLVVGGVIFDDGTVLKELRVDDLQPLGEGRVRFLRSTGVQTSVCHRIKAFQGQTELGSY